MFVEGLTAKICVIGLFTFQKAQLSRPINSAKYKAFRTYELHALCNFHEMG